MYKRLNDVVSSKKKKIARIKKEWAKDTGMTFKPKIIGKMSQTFTDGDWSGALPLPRGVTPNP